MKDAEEIDQIFTDNLKIQDPEPSAGMPKEQPESMFSCGANGDSQDWKFVTSGNGRKAPSPPADLQWQNKDQCPGYKQHRKSHVLGSIRHSWA